MTTSQTKKSFCSICTASCGIEVEVSGNEILAIKADKSNPMSQGYSCAKGRNAHHLLNAPDRIVTPLKQSTGKPVQANLDEALDEIASSLNGLKKQYGPNSIAVYLGNGVTFKTTVAPTVRAWLQSIGSHQFYTTMTIDQPAKFIAKSRHGVWSAGEQEFATADVLMLLGNNPVVSGYHCRGSFPGWRPGALKEARNRGLKLIVVDPRRTETAQQADVYLPIKPGQDAVLLAGILNYLLQEGLYDREFCAEHTENLDQLSNVVADYSLDLVAQKTGLSEDDIVAAARLFGTANKGCAVTGTGPNMAEHANLTEHLVECLNSACGRRTREGDPIPPSLLTPAREIRAMALPKTALPLAYNFAKNPERSRIRGGRQAFGEMPTATLAEEILTPGEGQIKALIVIGGNPVLSWPDQEQTIAALQELELLVCIEPRNNATVPYADYVLPASYGLERGEITSYNDFIYDRAFAQYSEAMVKPPGDAQEEWRYLAGLAKRMNLALHFKGGELDLASPPSSLEFLELLYPPNRTKVPLREIASHPGGKIFEQFDNQVALPAIPEFAGKLDFFPDEIPEEFTVLEQSLSSEQQDNRPYLLISRRDKAVFNSMCHELPSTNRTNPAFMHPEDLTSLGLQVGDRVLLCSAYGEVTAIVDADKQLSNGVVSISHCWGGSAANSDDPAATGTAIARLMTGREHYNSVCNMPRLTSVPVSIKPVN